MLKYTLIILMFVTGLLSCKTTANDLDNYDMSEFCDEYYVLKLPQGNSLYILIGRKDPFKKRFLIWKNYNYKQTGFGYCYSYKVSIDDAVKNGIYSSAGNAIEEAEDNLPTDGMLLKLANIVPLGRGQWSSDGEILVELCEQQ